VPDWKERSKKSGRQASAPQATLEMIKEVNVRARQTTAPSTEDWSRISPWAVAAGVKQLIDARNFDDARELASQYQEFGNRSRLVIVSAFAHHLLHLIDHAEHPRLPGVQPVSQ
jgi:hypothetical protein